MAGFNTAITGLKAATTMLNVTGNNVANSSTVGFKTQRTEFSDLYTKAVIGSGSANIPGSGVMVADISQDFSGGTLEYTNNSLDLAINGSGFFQVADAEGKLFYTRAGTFELDNEGYIRNNSGKYLRGYGLDPLGNMLPIQNLQVTPRENQPKATEIIDLAFNIDSEADAMDLNREFNKNDANSYTYSMTVGTYSNVGEEHSVRFYYAEQRPYKEVFSFSATNAATGTPLMVAPATYTGEAMDMSGLAFDAVPGPTTLQFDAASYDPAKGRVYLDNASKLILAAQDPRVDVDTVYYDFNNDTINFENNAEFSQYGDMKVNFGASPRANLLTGDLSERSASEVQRFSLDPANFTSGVAGNQLGTATTVDLGGVNITFPATATIEQVGETINAYESKIISSNPDIESIEFTATPAGYNIDVTWKPEVGEITGTFNVQELAGTVFTDANADGNPDVAEIYNGDNSYLSSYRMYAFLDDRDQLDLGKTIDPGSPQVTLTEEGPIIF